jgi:iron complex outermembrane receptor protein
MKFVTAMKFGTVLCGSAGLVGIAAPTWAQSTSTAPAAELETVVITGSRIVRDGYAAPTPVTVASIAELEQTTPSNIPDALNKLPQFSFSSTTAANGSAGGAPSVFGGNFLNLRAFGLGRTLILMDSRRVPSTAINGLVDVNTLPQMLIQRVDVVTGGASAVYGSDAVTGVVNFVLDTHYNGLKAVVQGGTSSRSDANSYRIGVAGGTDIGARGHFIGSVERYQNNGIRSHQDRPWSASAPIYVGSTNAPGLTPGSTAAPGSAANPYMLAQNVRISNTSFGGLVTAVKNGATPVPNSPLLNQQFLSDGSTVAFNAGTRTPTLSSNNSIGGDGGYYYDLNMTPPLRTNQAFGRYEYEFADHLTGYTQLGFAETQLFDQHSSNAAPLNFTITNDNPYLTSAEKTQLGPNSFTLSRLTRDLSADSLLNQHTDALNFTAGLNGSVFSKFKWDTYYTYGKARLHSVTSNNINYPNLFAAVDSVKDANGNIVCRVSTTLYPGCAPLDPFGYGNVSNAAKAFIYRDTEWHAVNTLNDFEGNISGPIFDNWAGPVSLALNAEYRAQSLSQNSSVDPLAAASYSALQNKPAVTPAGVWAYGIQGAQHGSNNVWETSAETVFPLLAYLPGVQLLEASGAIRYTDYSTSGAVHTWKYGLNYQPVEDLRLRWTESQDIRAPGLNDLFAPTAIQSVTGTDPKTGVSGVVPSYTGGNINLRPEVARTTTIGLVYSPSFVPRLHLSVDYYKINIDNALSAVNGSSTAVVAECRGSGGTSPVCDAIHVFVDPTTGKLAGYVTNNTINAALTSTHGVDVEVGYNFDLDDVYHALAGQLNLRALFAYQPDMKTKSFPTSDVVQSAGVAGSGGTVGFADKRVTTDISYKYNDLAFNWQVRYSSKLALTGTTGNSKVYYVDTYLPSIFYHDVGMSYAFKFSSGSTAQLFFNVNNLFDQAPRPSPTNNSAAAPGSAVPANLGDDTVGRYFTLGVRLKM